MLNRQSALVLAAVVIALALGSAPASAATIASYHALVPASPVYDIEKLGTITVTGCPIQDSDARMVDAYPVSWPEVAAAQGVNPASSTVLIHLDSRGNLVNARIANSSGNALFDEEALLGARMSKYAPEVRSCNAFARSYYLEVTFE